MTLLVTLLVACKKDQPVEMPERSPVTVTPAPPIAPAPSGEDALFQALSARDAAPPCADLEAMVPDPVASLTSLTTATSPPAVPMRAAKCLVTGHATEAAATIEGWMASPDTEGLARVVAGSLDAVPVAEATRFAAAGLAGPHAAVLKPLFAASTVPEVKALAAP